jgi:HAD superfamily hydrolase (TIGR01450 family)
MKGIGEIASKYDVFVVDSWGVLHDGSKAFEEAKEVLRNLMELGKKVVIATNSPSRTKKVESDLLQRGIEKNLYSDVVSSGEVAFGMLQKMSFKKCFYLGQKKHLSLLEGLSLECASSLEPGLFWLNTGPIQPTDSLESYCKMAKEALQLSIPMFCINPDRFSLFQGEKRICAGAIAQMYEEMGGEVSYVGKPFASMYRAIRNRVDSKAKFLAIGDSLETDIRGGASAGMDTLLVYTGVTSSASLSICPKYTLQELRW